MDLQSAVIGIELGSTRIKAVLIDENHQVLASGAYSWQNSLENGVWVYACEADGRPYDKMDYKGPIALILGSEGFGVSRLLKEKSAFIVSLPMRGKVNSLNVSCAGAVILYEVLKFR